jgi:L-asparaginase
MNTPLPSTQTLPTALDVATFAVVQLENHPLFNSGHGAVFTRDGINELEASVMVSRGFKKRGVGVMGLRHVRNPILLARDMLTHGEQDLEPAAHSCAGLDVPSAQGHTQLFGESAEILARQYGLDMVDPSYFFTQQRWDEHVRALAKSKSGKGCGTWDAEEYLPQGTCGAVALDQHGVICVATSTGGLTNKLTGRVGDTPVPGAGFWAEEWQSQSRKTASRPWSHMLDQPPVVLQKVLQNFLADCLPTPFLYTPVSNDNQHGPASTTRSIAVSGTGNGDSFLRTAAARTVGSIARFGNETGAAALSRVAGPGGDLQRSAGDRWKRTGEGEGGMIGIECTVVRRANGSIARKESAILQDFNCGGMFRAWIDDDGQAVMSIWSNGSPDTSTAFLSHTR